MINEYLLFFSLFLPRISLLVAYINGLIPPNNIPFIGDVILAVLVPRLLMLIYIATVMGFDTGWFWAHVVFFILSIGSCSSSSSGD